MFTADFKDYDDKLKKVFFKTICPGFFTPTDFDITALAHLTNNPNTTGIAFEPASAMTKSSKSAREECQGSTSALQHEQCYLDYSRRFTGRHTKELLGTRE
jgi:hypothetical protein